jgi:hypothetical protein
VVRVVPDAERDLCNCVHRHHAGTITPILQLPDLPVEPVATV